ncbi:MAG: SLC13 family permease [Verrucomicrobiota bacterium]
MTLEIAAVLTILVVAIFLFIIEKPRMDVVALLVLAALGVSGLVSPAQALAGFSNPAVITVWSMFILSAGLSNAGVADALGKKLLKISGKSEARMIIVIMLSAGSLSAFMNNIGVAALMLPVVMDLARKTGNSPSRLLMPLAYGSLLGGLTTLVGTPPNLVAASSLESAGYKPFSLFDFTPVGIFALGGGTLFMVLFGRHLLPKTTLPDSANQSRRQNGTATRFDYGLDARRFHLRVGPEFPPEGRSLNDLGLGTILGFNILEITHSSQNTLNPGPETLIYPGDQLTVQGDHQQLQSFLALKAFDLGASREMIDLFRSRDLETATIEIAPASELDGLTVAETDFRNRFDAHILGIKRKKRLILPDLAPVTLKEGDQLILHAPREVLQELPNLDHFKNFNPFSDEAFKALFPEDDRLLELILGDEAGFAVGKTVAESGLVQLLGLRVIGIARQKETIVLPRGDERIQKGDILLVQGSKKILDQLLELPAFKLNRENIPPPNGGQHHDSATVEVTLAPESSLAGRTLTDIGFRTRYGLSVLAIWRKGHAYQSYLRNMTLLFGDAFFVSGPREKLEALAKDSDFLVLSDISKELTAPAIPKMNRISAVVIMAGVVAVVLVGALPIAIAAVSGASLMVLSKCLSMREAYRSIDWKSVFLIAGMIPLGTAMQQSGAAAWIAGFTIDIVSPFGPWALIAGLYLVVALATTIVPTAALVMITAPIAIQAANDLAMSPYTAMMAIAIAASASFTSPISHPANVLVMGPGGYRFIDYVKTGVPLALTVFLVVIPALYFFWPPN